MNYAFKQSELVDLVKNKDDVALNYLYDHYAGAIYAELLNRVNNKEIAGILLETVFLKIISDIEDFDSRKFRLFTWMVQVTHTILEASTDQHARKPTNNPSSIHNFSSRKGSFT